MRKRLIIVLISFFTAFSWSHRNVHAVERVVLNSNKTDRWYENVYLMGDKIDWMTFRNFTVQIGDKGELLYHFPKWESGKYDTHLFRDDLDGNKFSDVIIVLDNFEDPIHVLQHEVDPYQVYKEVPVEPVNDAIKRLVKMEKKGDIVTITTKHKTFKINVKGFHYTTVKPYSNEVFIGIDQVNYTVLKHKIIADAPILIGISGLIGHLKLNYDWNGNGYDVKSVSFKRYVPHRND